jgi:hypothetical protein
MKKQFNPQVRENISGQQPWGVSQGQSAAITEGPIEIDLVVEEGFVRLFCA